MLVFIVVHAFNVAVRDCTKRKSHVHENYVKYVNYVNKLGTYSCSFLVNLIPLRRYSTGIFQVIYDTVDAAIQLFSAYYCSCSAMLIRLCGCYLLHRCYKYLQQPASRVMCKRGERVL